MIVKTGNRDTNTVGTNTHQERSENMQKYCEKIEITKRPYLIFVAVHLGLFGSAKC